MGSTDSTGKHTVHTGLQCESAERWKPFTWNEPRYGSQTLGSYTVARAFGTTGDIQAGFWRLVVPNFSIKSIHSCADGDRISVVIDGTATLTTISTGAKLRVGPGNIISCPKGWEVEWEYDAPYFKTYWCRWNGAQPSKDPPKSIQVNHVNDNPTKWTPYCRADDKGGELVSGELYSIWANGSTGSFRSGIWRSGRGISSTNVEPDGRMVNPYIGATGDETMLLLAGEVDIIEVESGKKHCVRAGDVLGLSAGMHVTWVSRAPFVRKLWVTTNDWE